MYTVVGVLGGIIGALLIILIGGGYYFYTKTMKESMENEQGAVEMIDVAIDNQRAVAMGQTIDIEDNGEYAR